MSDNIEDDLSHYSTEELMKMRDEYSQQPQQNDPLSQYSTEELRRMASEQASQQNEPTGLIGVGSSLGAGMAKGLVGAPGIIGDIQAIARKAEPYLGIKTPEHPLVQFPTSAETIEAAKPYIPALQQTATTFPEKAAETIGSFMAMPGGPEAAGLKEGFRAGPALASQLTRQAVIPGLASESLGAAFEGAPAEPYARFAGSMLGARPEMPGREAKLAEAGARAQRAEDILGASERLGVNIPYYAATEARTPKALASAVSAVPFAGAKIASSAEEAIKGIGSAAEKLHEEMGGADVVSAGQAAKSQLHNVVTEKTPEKLELLYKDLSNRIDPSVKTPLNQTSILFQDLQNRRMASDLSPVSPSMALVRKAVLNPDGLTYEGIRYLRSTIGNKLKNAGLMPAFDKEELKRIYGALSDDLRTAVVRGGDKEALSAFEDANRQARISKIENWELSKVIGKSGQHTPQQVIGQLESMIKSGTKGNIDRLRLVRSKFSPDDWNYVASGVVQRLGRDDRGNFSPDRFLTAYGKMLPQAKDTLFGPPSSSVRKSLEDMATVSQKFSELQKYANVSKTAHVGVAIELMASLMKEPLLAFGQAAGALGLAHILSKPMTARAAAHIHKAVYNAVKENRSISLENAAIRSAYNSYLRTVNEEMGKEKSENREQRASGGKVGKRDYPAKRLTLLERAARKAHNELSEGSKPLMDMPDEQIASGLHESKEG